MSPALRYLKERFADTPAWQVSANGTREYVTRQGIRVAPAMTWMFEYYPMRLVRELADGWREATGDRRGVSRNRVVKPAN